MSSKWCNTFRLFGEYDVYIMRYPFQGSSELLYVVVRVHASSYESQRTQIGIWKYRIGYMNLQLNLKFMWRTLKFLLDVITSKKFQVPEATCDLSVYSYIYISTLVFCILTSIVISSCSCRNGISIMSNNIPFDSMTVSNNLLSENVRIIHQSQSIVISTF